MDRPSTMSLWNVSLAALACVAAQDCVANSCSEETLSSVLLSPVVPVSLFSNPNGNALTPEETAEVRESVTKIRSTLGTVASLVSVRSPYVPSALEITIGANAKATGYAFSPKSYAVQTTKAGQVLVSFGTAPPTDVCKIFWFRVSIPPDSVKRESSIGQQAL